MLAKSTLSPTTLKNTIFWHFLTFSVFVFPFLCLTCYSMKPQNKNDIFLFWKRKNYLRSGHFFGCTSFAPAHLPSVQESLHNQLKLELHDISRINSREICHVMTLGRFGQGAPQNLLGPCRCPGHLLPTSTHTHTHACTDYFHMFLCVVARTEPQKRQPLEIPAERSVFSRTWHFPCNVSA